MNELRGEVAAQRKTIEELKALVEKLADAKTAAAKPVENGTPGVRPVSTEASADANTLPVSAPSESNVRLMNTVYLNPATVAAMVDPAPNAPAKKETPLTAGWNGEHFYIRSADGQFSISPYGYLDTDYRAYKGDGAPSATFVGLFTSSRAGGTS